MEFQLLRTAQTISDGLASRVVTRAIFLDIEAAFDAV